MNITGNRYCLPLTESHGKTLPPVLPCLVHNFRTGQLCGRVGEPKGTLRPRGHHGSLCGILTCGLIQTLLCDVVVLADPLAITLEVDLRGWEGSAVQFHWLVLYDVSILWLQQEVGQLLRRC